MQSILLILMASACASAFQVPAIRAARAVAVGPAVTMGPFNRGEKKTKAVPDSADELYNVDITEAAEAITEADEPPKSKLPKLAVSDIDWAKTGEAAEVFAVNAFKFVKKVVEAAIEFNEEHDVVGKAKDAAVKVVELEKENEVLLKARATVELSGEAAAKALENVKSKKPAVKKPAATKAAVKKPAAKKPAAKKAVAKKATSNTKTSPMKFDLPKF